MAAESGDSFPDAEVKRSPSNGGKHGKSHRIRDIYIARFEDEGKRVERRSVGRQVEAMLACAAP